MVAAPTAYKLVCEASRSAHFFCNAAVYLGTFMIGLCRTSPLTLRTPVTENDPSAFFPMSLHSSLEIASSQVSASIVVCAKTGCAEPIAQVARIETTAELRRWAIAGPPRRPDGMH